MIILLAIFSLPASLGRYFHILDMRFCTIGQEGHLRLLHVVRFDVVNVSSDEYWALCVWVARIRLNNALVASDGEVVYCWFLLDGREDVGSTFCDASGTVIGIIL